MSNSNNDTPGDDDGPQWAREEGPTDEHPETMDTAPPSDTDAKSYECAHCGKVFEGEHAQQKMAGHVSANHRRDPTTESTDDTSAPTKGRAIVDALPDGADIIDSPVSFDFADDGTTIERARCRVCDMAWRLPEETDAFHEHLDLPCHEANVQSWNARKNAAAGIDTPEPAPTRAESESPPWYKRLGAVAKSAGGKRPTFTVAGKKIRVANWLDPEDNATIGPVSFMSSVPEKHALSFGFAITFPIAVSVLLGIDPLVLLTGIFGGAVAGQRAIRRALKTQHAKDAVSELAYTGLGMLLAIGTIALLAVIAAAFDRDPELILERFLRFLRTAFEISQAT